MDTSALIVLVFFSLGCTVGALLVSLNREKVIERVRAEFEERLAAALPKTITERSRTHTNLDWAEVDNKDDSARAERDGFYNEWGPLSVRTGAVHTHVPF